MEHEQLRPLVRDLALQHHDASAFQFWCEAWGDDCAAGILASAVNPDSQLPPYIVLLLPEAAHPELDPMLKERLKEAFARQDFLMAHRTAVLVLRAGSRSLRASVDALLAADPASRPNSCEVQGYLVGYLFRVAPEDAAKFLIAKFADRSDVCAGQLFHTLNAARYSDDLVPIAVKALNSPNPGAVGSAALLLGERGPNSVEDALWRRLRAFWEIWRDRKTELRGTLPGDDGQFETALLEQQLASALAHATNWKLTPAEQGRLREGCLTEQCRAVAEGNMYLNP